ncbi:hypothetical protein QVD17_06447 [Tagetes erecta]|uniref:Bifunctional inhibitor/plant lipid transfer protein/seed storage helical domain-containing protein n=1 Tax=Tagetes erecta TaxID=13708 RepID=A0AAD8LJD7_TARER|nr:hypothetical protein QVD17_06447 [Tagetes erecta]
MASPKTSNISKMKRLLALIALPLLVVILVVGATHSEAVDEAVPCDPRQLMPCLGSIMHGTPPPPLCCKKLKLQKPCMCGYIKNPQFRKYVKSPNAKKVSKICHVTMPKCKPKTL